MTTRWLDGPGYWLAVGVLSVVVLGMGAVVGVTVVMPEVVAPGPVAADPSTSPSPSPSPTALASSGLARMTVALPPGADCNACHLTNGGVALKDIPTLAHPVEGWSDCTACHADDRLVKTAPGHTGIHKDQCLACHKPPSPTASSALPRPHHIVAGTACITCHGTKAPLPTDMAGRTNCWICHPDSSSATLFGQAAPTARPSPAGSAGGGGLPTPAP